MEWNKFQLVAFDMPQRNLMKVPYHKRYSALQHTLRNGISLLFYITLFIHLEIIITYLQATLIFKFRHMIFVKTVIL